MKNRSYRLRENSYLALEQCDEDADAMPDLYGHSITYRIALGTQRGKKVFTLQTLAPHATGNSRTRLATEAGFSLVNQGLLSRPDKTEVPLLVISTTDDDIAPHLTCSYWLLRR